MKSTQHTLHRSWLLVPASRPEAIERCAGAGPDVIVLDLVELVVERDRESARERVRSPLEGLAASGRTVYAQTEPQSIDADLRACVRPGLSGVIVSRAESAAQIRQTAEALDALERERGIDPGTIRIVIAVETARGNQEAYDIVSASPRVSGVTLGRADLVMDLRPEPSGEIHLMPYLMQRIVIIAGALGVTPIGAWWRAPDRGLLATPENTYAAARRGRAIGFKGVMCVSADQVESINRAYVEAAHGVAASGDRQS